MNEASSRVIENEATLRFTMARRYRNIGWTCTIVFTTFSIFFTWAAATNVDGSFTNPIAYAWFFGAFWGTLTVFGLYVTVAYYTYSLTITAAAVTERCVFGGVTLPIRDIIEAE